VLFGTEKFWKYIQHQEFFLETDNQALSWLLSHPRQLGKIGRWVVKISKLKFRVRHIRGTQNVVDDMLSRMFEAPNSEVPNQVDCPLALTSFPLAFHEVGKLHREDALLADIVTKLERGDKVGNYSLSKGILTVGPIKGGVANLRFLPPRFLLCSRIFMSRRCVVT
jgi:hypothetical protein